MSEGPGRISSAADRLSDALAAGAAKGGPVPGRGAFRKGRARVRVAERRAASAPSASERVYRVAERVLIGGLLALRRRTGWHLLGLRVLFVTLWIRVHWIGLSMTAIVAAIWWWWPEVSGWFVGLPWRTVLSFLTPWANP